MMNRLLFYNWLHLFLVSLKWWSLITILTIIRSVSKPLSFLFRWDLFSLVLSIRSSVLAEDRFLRYFILRLVLVGFLLSWWLILGCGDWVGPDWSELLVRVVFVPTDKDTYLVFTAFSRLGGGYVILVSLAALLGLQISLHTVILMPICSRPGL